MEETRNYIKEYFSNNEHDLTTLLHYDEESNESVLAIKKQIGELQKSIDEKSIELHNVLDKAYSKNFTPTSKKIGIRYMNRHRDEFIFDLDTGYLVEDDLSNYNIYTIDTKIENICVVVGYSFELATIIMKEYKCSVAKNNSKMATKLIKELAISFMENKCVELKVGTNEINELDWLEWKYQKSLELNDKEFINTFYGVEYLGNKDLKRLRECNLKNKSFEIIMKTAPKEIIDNLLNLELENSIPIHKIIGISLETYNKAIERNIIKEVYDNREYINGKNNEKYGIYKTEKEWLDFIDEIKAYEEDLAFYNITIGNTNYTRSDDLMGLLLTSYSKTNTCYYNEDDNNGSIFKEYYSFGKFVGYVINETINQGYNRVRDFITELRDYLTMCKQDDIKPTLYSSYLRQTHDITSRNHKVIVEKENEEIFKSRYKDFKEYKGKEYMIIAPKNSSDLKKEGDTLNHCVASYIKRVIDGECLILFLRKEREESLITIEIRHNDIVQVRGLHNRKPTANEIQILKDFAKCRNIGINF